MNNMNNGNIDVDYIDVDQQQQVVNYEFNNRITYLEDRIQMLRDRITDLESIMQMLGLNFHSIAHAVHDHYPLDE